MPYHINHLILKFVTTYEQKSRLARHFLNPPLLQPLAFSARGAGRYSLFGTDSQPICHWNILIFFSAHSFQSWRLCLYISEFIPLSPVFPFSPAFPSPLSPRSLRVLFLLPPQNIAPTQGHKKREESCKDEQWIGKKTLR